jgi:hypothetical protein
MKEFEPLTQWAEFAPSTQWAEFAPSTQWAEFAPSTQWAEGGPILSRQRINREFNHNSGLWQAFRGQGVMHTQQDSSELVAGMRCVVASHYGEEVEVPDELCQQDG